MVRSLRAFVRWTGWQIILFLLRFFVKSYRYKGVRFYVEKAVVTFLFCVDFVYAKNAAGEKISASVKGIKLFDETIDGNFQRIVKRIDKGGYNKLISKVDELAEAIGEVGVKMLSERGYVVKFGRKYIDFLDDTGQVIFRGDPDDAVIFLVAKSLDEADLISKFAKVILGRRKFNAASQALVNAGYFLKASARGLAPDFIHTPQYLYKGEKKFGQISIKLTGSRGKDFALANAEAGLPKTPKGYTWHHLDDYDPITNSCTMQLVKTEVHDMASHTGGSALWQHLYEIIYK